MTLALTYCSFWEGNTDFISPWIAILRYLVSRKFCIFYLLLIQEVHVYYGTFKLSLVLLDTDRLTGWCLCGTWNKTARTLQSHRIYSCCLHESWTATLPTDYHARVNCHVNRLYLAPDIAITYVLLILHVKDTYIKFFNTKLVRSIPHSCEHRLIVKLTTALPAFFTICIWFQL